MFTVSCYAFHPFLLKFVRIWKYVQVVSNVLHCLLSMLCCQCMDMMIPSSSASGGSNLTDYVFKPQLPESATVEPRRPSPLNASGEPQHTEHLVIDLPPQKDDAKERTKCSEYRLLVEKDKTVQDTSNPGLKKIELSASLYRIEDSREKIKNNIPAVHSMKKIDKKVIPELPAEMPI